MYFVRWNGFVTTFCTNIGHVKINFLWCVGQCAIACTVEACREARKVFPKKCPSYYPFSTYSHFSILYFVFLLLLLWAMGWVTLEVTHYRVTLVQILRSHKHVPLIRLPLKVFLDNITRAFYVLGRQHEGFHLMIGHVPWMHTSVIQSEYERETMESMYFVVTVVTKDLHQ